MSDAASPMVATKIGSNMNMAGDCAKGSIPRLAAEAARAIVEAGVRTIGIDALSVDATPADDSPVTFDAHIAILGSGGVIVENLAHLERVERLAAPFVSVLPLRLADADGAPVRAVAFDREALTGR